MGTEKLVIWLLDRGYLINPLPNCSLSQSWWHRDQLFPYSREMQNTRNQVQLRCIGQSWWWAPSAWLGQPVWLASGHSSVHSWQWYWSEREQFSRLVGEAWRLSLGLCWMVVTNENWTLCWEASMVVSAWSGKFRNSKGNPSETSRTSAWDTCTNVVGTCGARAWAVVDSDRLGHSAFQCPTFPHNRHRDSNILCCSDFREDGVLSGTCPLGPWWALAFSFVCDWPESSGPDFVIETSPSILVRGKGGCQFLISL